MFSYLMTFVLGAALGYFVGSKEIFDSSGEELGKKKPDESPPDGEG